MKAKLIITSLITSFLVNIHLHAQPGGDASLSFLNLPVSAKHMALGGVNISSPIDTSITSDVSQFLTNPALSNKHLHNQVSLNYQPYLAGIQNFGAQYLRKFSTPGIWGIGLQYFNYGSFKGMDNAGNPTSDFQAHDYAITIHHSRVVKPFSLGINVKWVQSQIDHYNAQALAFDIGGVYKHPDADLQISMVFQNFGFWINQYTTTSQPNLPSDVKIGISYKPTHMPVRFSATGYNLFKHNAYYAVNTPESEFSVSQKIFSHINLGGEFIITPGFQIRGGYNYLTRSTLKLQQTTGGSGISLGFKVNISFFELSYGHQFTHVAGGNNHITLTSNMRDMLN